MRRIQRPASPFDADFLKHKPGGQDHDQSTHAGGRGGGSKEPRRGEVFVAGLRGYKGSFKDVRAEREQNEKFQRLSKTDFLGEDGAFAPEVKGDMDPAKVLEKNDACGSWYETDAQGNKIPVSEPSIHAIVEGDETDILRRAAHLGQKYDQQAVAVAIHDPGAGDTGVFSLRLADGIGDDAMEAITEHYVSAGLGGATGFLDRSEFRFLATSAADATIIRRATAGIPAEFRPQLDFQPARVRFVDASEYASLIVAKAGERKVRADVIIMGLPRRR